MVNSYILHHHTLGLNRRLIRKIGDAEGWDRYKRRDFQNDALIALTARRHGATLVTANLSDFDLLAQELRVHMLAAGA
jgi:predicted nucleic acid-binding protein